MTVAALAGRRVDAGDASISRFPSTNVRLVRHAIRVELERMNIRVLVCSAACGADLLALAAAGDLGIRRRAVLPVEAEEFRRTSVADRPGDWPPLFDRIVAELAGHGDLVTLQGTASDTQTYLDTNIRVLDDAQAIARETGSDAVAIVVWDGQSRGREDVTEAFGREARHRGLRVFEISTLRAPAG